MDRPHADVNLDAHHDTLVAWPAHNGREHCTRRVVAGKASLDHSGPIVAHLRI